MGLIRKTLAVGTVGVVSGSSKKQRVARQSLQTQQAILRELRGPVATSKQIAAHYAGVEQRERAEARRVAVAKGQDPRPFWER